MHAVVDNGKVVALIPANSSFVLNNHQYPANWLQLASTEHKEIRGIYPVVKSKRPDARYRNVTENAPVWDADNKVVRIEYSVSGVDMKHVKTLEIARMTDHGNSLLALSNQIVLDAHDFKRPVPAKWVVHRTAVRKEIERLCDGINKATDEKSVVDVLLTANWPTPE